MATLLSNLLEKLNRAVREDEATKDANGEELNLGDRVVPADCDAANEEEVASEITSIEGDKVTLTSGDEVKADDLRKVGDSVSTVTGLTVGEGRTRRVREGEEVAKDVEGNDLAVGDSFKTSGDGEHEVASVRAVTDEDKEAFDKDDGHIVTNKEGDEFHSDECMAMDKNEAVQVRHRKLRESRLTVLRESDEVAADSDGDEVTVGDKVKEVGKEDEDAETVAAVEPHPDGGHNLTLADGSELHSSEADKVSEADEEGEEDKTGVEPEKFGEAAESATVANVVVTPVAAIIDLDNGTQLTILGAPAGYAVLRMLKGATISISKTGEAI